MLLAADGIWMEQDPHKTARRRVWPFLVEYGRRVSGENLVSGEDGAEAFLTVAADLLADIFHLGAAMGVDPDQIVAKAFYHFEPESCTTQITVERADVPAVQGEH